MQPRIRAEAEPDRKAVHALNAAAFGRATEVLLVDMLRAGLERCKELGAAAAVVLGHPGFYPKFGFLPAARFGLASEYDVPPEVFMALELRQSALRGASGTVRYHAAFAEVEP